MLESEADKHSMIYFRKNSKMDLNLKSRTAVVCGSTQGLGLATAKELAAMGANIVLMARNEEKLKSVIKELPAAGSQQHQYLVADFNDPGQVEASIKNYCSSGRKAEILVNNTGGPAGGKAIDAALSEFESAFKQHLINNQILVQALVPSMKEAGFGRIVNIISTSVKQPIPGLGVSNTIRAAVANWSKTLATELGPFGITVNNVLPGFTKTVRAEYVINKKAEESGRPHDEILKSLISEIPAGRIGEPAEFAAAVAFLCSPSASYINGINLPVDGGRLATL